jgi:hypothetical protein
MSSSSGRNSKANTMDGKKHGGPGDPVSNLQDGASVRLGRVLSRPGSASNSRNYSRQNSRENSAERDDTEWQCDKYESFFRSDNSRILECEYCHTHRCIKCLNLPVACYNGLSGREDFPWFCEQCLMKTLNFIHEAKSIEDRCNDFLTKFEEKINTRFEDIEKEVVQCKQDIQQMKGDITQGGNADSPGRMMKAAPIILSEATKEIQSRVERKNNVVIYNMPESMAILKEDVETHDRGVIVNMCGKMGLEIKQEEIINTRRLGRKQHKIVEDQSVEVPRTVLVALAEHTKPKVMRNLYKLRGLTHHTAS